MNILLICFNPNIPRVGPGSRQMTRLSERAAEENLRTLCGISLSHSKCASAMFLACFGISLVGDSFVDSNDRQALVDILKETEREHGWPTGIIRDGLIDSWRANTTS